MKRRKNYREFRLIGNGNFFPIFPIRRKSKNFDPSYNDESIKTAIFVHQEFESNLFGQKTNFWVTQFFHGKKISGCSNLEFEIPSKKSDSVFS